MQRAFHVLTAALLGLCLAHGAVELQTGGPDDRQLASAGPAAGPVAAGPAADGCAPHQTSLLFTQLAETATITPVDPASMDIELVLHKVGPVTTFFSNTPDRLAGRLMTNRFVDYWAANETDWVPNAALMGTGPLGAERVLILTLKNAPIYDNTTRTLTYNASLILKNTTVLSDPQLSPVTSLVNNIARAAQEYLINLKDAGGKLPTFNMTDIQLFIDNVGGCVGWNGVFVHTGVCGGGGGYGYGWGRPHVCGGYHGIFIGGVWCA